MMTVTSLKAWYWVHKWTSLICTLFMLLLCLTGLPLIFFHEIDEALGRSVDAPELASDEAAGPGVSVDTLVADARERRPDEKVQFLVADPEHPELWFVRMGETRDAHMASSFFYYDARTGDYLHEYPLNQGIMNIIYRLHVDMFAGLPGTLFLGFMGLLLVASLVSGTVLYSPYMRKLRFGEVRRHRSPRLKWLDLHNLLGIVTLVWFLVVGATGVINTLAIPIFGQWQNTQLAEMTADYQGRERVEDHAPVEQALASARQAEPDMQLSFMAFPGNDFASPHHFVAFMQGESPLTSKLLKPVLIDAQTGELVMTADMPWYVSTLLLSQPLHFGDYGGLPLKILWALLTVVTIVVLGSGLYLWFKRRNQSFESWLAPAQQRTPGRPALSGLERS